MVHAKLGQKFSWSLHGFAESVFAVVYASLCQVTYKDIHLQTTIWKTDSDEEVKKYGQQKEYTDKSKNTIAVSWIWWRCISEWLLKFHLLKLKN